MALSLFAAFAWSTTAVASVARVGSFTKAPGAPTTQVVPHLLGAMPAAILFFSTGAATQGLQRSARFSVGMTDGVFSYSVGSSSLDLVPLGTAARRFAGKAITFVDFGGAIVAEADLVSWDATTFTLAWTTPPPTPILITFMAIGGPGVSARVVHWQTSPVPGQQVVTGVGFRPALLIHIQAGHTFVATPPAVAAGAHVNFSVMTGTGLQWGVSVLSVDGQRPTVTRSGTALLGLVSVDPAPTIARTTTWNTMDADGFTVTHSGSPQSAHTATLALAGVSADAKLFSRQFAPGMQQIATALFQPEAVLLATAGAPGGPTSNLSMLSLGVGDGITSGSVAYFDGSGVTTTAVTSQQTNNKVLTVLDAAGVTSQASLTALTASPPGFILDWGPAGIPPPLDGGLSPSNYFYLALTSACGADGTPCNDGNLCTLGDACRSGVCGPTSVVTCTALDTCHSAGVCAPATGVCSNPLRADGLTCDDSNRCTSGETCAAGVCGAPSMTVTCTALDSCHVAGACAPATGVCTNPPSADGVTCDDANRCTSGETCTAGVCGAPAMTVTCTPLDSCHVAGACAPATGVCTNPPRADGVACDDSNACTQGEQCTGGLCGSATQRVTCTALDACHSIGVCAPGTGLCSTPLQRDGFGCDDGNLCTTGETCQTGVCGAPTSSRACPAPDNCHLDGTCAPASGLCSNPLRMGCAASPPVIIEDANLEAIVGRPWSYNADGAVRSTGAVPQTFRACGGPEGLTVDATSGAVSWSPASEGSFEVCVSAHNVDGDDEYRFTVRVRGPWRLRVGCGCDSGGDVSLLVLLGWAAWRGARRRRVDAYARD